VSGEHGWGALHWSREAVTIGAMRDGELLGDPFAALGDPHRRAIVVVLIDGPRSVQEIANVLPISRPAVSRHLRLLKEAGLVVDEPVGARRLYRLDGREEDIPQARAPRAQSLAPLQRAMPKEGIPTLRAMPKGVEVARAFLDRVWGTAAADLQPIDEDASSHSAHEG